jgi:hypothetical protein
MDVRILLGSCATLERAKHESGLPQLMLEDRLRTLHLATEPFGGEHERARW